MAPRGLTSRAAPSSSSSNPDASNASYILALTGAFAGISVLVVFLRMMVRTFMLKAVGLDDWVMLIALTFSIGVLVCFVGETGHGLGRHNADVPPSELKIYYHWNYFHSLLVMLGISCVKVSVGCFLRRFMQTKKQKTFLLCAIIFLIAFTIACAGTLIFSCVPVSASWNFVERKTAKCFSNTTFRNIGIFNSSINIFTDVLFAVLPIPIVWRLQVNLRTKITLAFILALGFFACFAAGIKLSKQLTVLSDPNSMWNPMFQLWNYVELNVGILAASLPVLRPLFTKLVEESHRVITGATRSTASDRRSADLRHFDHQSSKYSYGKKRNSRAGQMHYQGQSDMEITLNGSLHLGNVGHTTNITGGHGKKQISHDLSESRTICDGDESIWLDEESSLENRQIGSGEILKTTEVNVHAI